LTCHEGILRLLLGRRGILRRNMIREGFKRDHSVLAEEVAVSSSRSYWIGDRDGEDGVPPPDLRFLEDQVQEELEVGRISKIEKLSTQRFGSALEMLRPSNHT
jgi:hypothetical protein